MSAANSYAGRWLPAALSRIPVVRRQFDFNRDPYVRAQIIDTEKTESERREGRGSGMVKASKVAMAYSPPPEIARAIDRRHFNGRWMAEMRDSVFAKAAKARSPDRSQEQIHKTIQSPSSERQMPEKEIDMADFIKINGDNHMHLSTVKRLREVTDKERESLAELGPHINASDFNTRIDEAGRGKSYARETVDEIAMQGVPLVQIDEGAYVPAANVTSVRDLTNDDRKKFEKSTGRTLSEGFKSRLETRAGMVLATVDSQEIMDRMSRPYQPQASEPQAKGARNMEQEADAVMDRAAKRPGKSVKQPQPEI